MRNASNISRRRKSALSDGNAEYMAKRAELVEIAGLRFKSNGFQATTLAEIGRMAGLDRATVYYYFGSKEELFRECLKVGVDANIKECERIFADKNASARDRLKGIIVQLMKAYDANYPHMYVYIQEEMSQISNEKSVWATQIVAQTRKFERMVMSLIGELREKGEFRTDIPVSIAANAIFGMLNWTHRWYQPGGAHPAEEVSDTFCKIFFEGALDRKKR
jgi:TetR/AcrR family transcriptional regulator, cholesterol catabolism regulator